MKIIFTADSHLFYGNQTKALREMMEKIREEKPDVVCIAGDIGEVLIYQDSSLVQELFSIQPTLWVAGNHDLYSEYKRYAPPEAMEECLKAIPYGIPLQKSWEDKCTFYEKNNCLFLGTIGFPDFASPKLMMPPKYYDGGCPTIDGSYINLQGGWLQYTRSLMYAFENKLKLVDDSKCKNIIIITHYAGFLSQYKLNPNDEISVYFYCHGLGEMIKKAAERNAGKNFYCVAGHGHEYMVGQWIRETDNITTHGIVTTYHDQKYITLDIPAID